MRKSLIIAAALSAMAFSMAPASAAPMTGQLGKGITTQSEVQKVHWTGRHHYHGRKHWRGGKHHRRGWHKRRQHCFIRIGRRVCVLR